MTGSSFRVTEIVGIVKAPEFKFELRAAGSCGVLAVCPSPSLPTLPVHVVGFSVRYGLSSVEVLLINH